MINSKPENLKCPDCQGEMTPRSSVHGKFWGCKNYPQCKGTRDSSGNSKYERQSRSDREDHEDTGPDAYDHVNRWNRRNREYQNDKRR